MKRLTVVTVFALTLALAGCAVSNVEPGSMPGWGKETFDRGPHGGA